MAAKNKKRPAQSNINMVSQRTSTRTERLTSGRGRASNIAQQESLYWPTRLNTRRGVECGAAGWYRVKSLGAFSLTTTVICCIRNAHSLVKPQAWMFLPYSRGCCTRHGQMQQHPTGLPDEARTLAAAFTVEADAIWRSEAECRTHEQILWPATLTELPAAACSRFANGFSLRFERMRLIVRSVKTRSLQLSLRR
jgi:hypothetical protein